MPELASPNGGYKLPQIRYEPPRTPTFEATQIVPDLRGAAALQGSAASLNLVAETIAKLPDLVTKSLATGRKEAEQKQVHGIKMDALAGNQTPAQIRALEGFSFGDDDSLSYKPVDPLLSQMKYEDAVVDRDYKRALAKRALAGPQTKPSLYEQINGAAPGSAGLPDGGVNGEILPPLSSANANTGGRGVLSEGVPQNEAELRAMQDVANTPQPPLPPEPALGAEAPVAPAGRAALAAPGAGPATAPVSSAVATAAAEPPADFSGMVKATSPNEAHRLYEGGKLVKILPPGANAWVNPPADHPAADPLATKEGVELIERNYTAAQIRAMSEEEKQAALAKPKSQAPTAQQMRMALEYGVDVGGLSRAEASTAIKAAMDKLSDLPPVVKKGFDQLRGEMARNPVIKQAGVQNKGFQNILAGYEQQNGAGDMMMIDGFARLINPSMGVTGQMVANFKEALPLMEKWFQLPFDKFSDGAKLTKEGRDMFLKAAKAAHEAEMEKVRDSIRAYGEVAKTYGVPQDLVERAGMQAYLVEPPHKAAPAPNGQPPEGGYVVGKRYKGVDGSVKTYLGGSLDNDASWGE